MSCLFNNTKKVDDKINIIKSKIPDLIDDVISYNDEETPISYNEMDLLFTKWINTGRYWLGKFSSDFTTPLVISFFAFNQTFYNDENKREIMQKYLENLLSVVDKQDYEY